MKLGLAVVIFIAALSAKVFVVVESFQNILFYKKHVGYVTLFESNNEDITGGRMIKVKERLRKMKDRQKEVRDKTLTFAKSMVLKPITQVASPRAIALVLKDTAEGLVDNVSKKPMEMDEDEDVSTFGSAMDRAEAAFEKADNALKKLEDLLEAVTEARLELQIAKEEVRAAISDAETTSEAMASAAAVISSVVEPSVLTDISDLSISDIDFSLTEMAPPFINEDQCLVPGEPLVRVEKAPDNSRRIFAGVDILASVNDLWTVLTDYHHLQNVVPNLVTNEVLDLYPPIETPFNFTEAGNLPDEEQCKLLSQNMKGAKLKQVGGAKVVGINFSARTTLEVREWPNGLPDFAHFNDELYLGKSRNSRAKEMKNVPLTRYKFPRPFAVSSLPTKDISMQSIVDDDGEFRLYQGVWRMQPLPGCAPSGASATRLTYAVEISPRSYLPVQLIEGRIAKDLCNNLIAIRDVVSKQTPII